MEVSSELAAVWVFLTETPERILLILYLAGMFVLFSLIWRALAVQRQYSLCLRVRPWGPKWFEWVRRRLVRFSEPYGSIFLTLGILGTFLGLAINLGDLRDYATFTVMQAQQPDLDEEALSVVVSGVVDGIGLSLFSTIAGIFLSLLSKACWPVWRLEELSFGEIKKYFYYYSGVPRSENVRYVARRGLYTRTIHVLSDEMGARPEIDNNLICGKVDRFLHVVADFMDTHRAQIKNLPFRHDRNVQVNLYDEIQIHIADLIILKEELHREI